MASETDAAGNIGSATLSLTFDTAAPAVTESLANDTGASSTDKITFDPTLTGSGDANALVHFTVDGTPIAATATATASGSWAFTPIGLADGNHTVIASETDAAGNVGSNSFSSTSHTSIASPSIVSFAPDTDTIGDGVTSASVLTLTGNASANDLVKVYDGGSLLGSTVADAGGAWSYTSASLSNGVHAFAATDIDVAGNVSVSSPPLTVDVESAVPPTDTTGSSSVVYGTPRNDTITSTAANETFFGNGGNDTFVFPKSFGTDVIADFQPNNDVVQLSHDVFSDITSILDHASQVGADVVIAADARDSLHFARHHNQSTEQP